MSERKIHAMGEVGALCVEGGYRNMARPALIAEPGETPTCRRCAFVIKQRTWADTQRILKARKARIEEALGKVTAALKAHDRWQMDYGGEGYYDPACPSALHDQTQEALEAADEALKP